MGQVSPRSGLWGGLVWGWRDIIINDNYGK